MGWNTYGFHAATETPDGYSGDRVCAACGVPVWPGP